MLNARNEYRSFFLAPKVVHTMNQLQEKAAWHGE